MSTSTATHGGGHLSTTSLGTKRFRESVHLIPSRAEFEGKRPPRYRPYLLELWIAGLLSASMIGLAIGLEVALSMSQKNNGFKVPSRNVFKFASASFLASFFPTLLAIPLALVLSASDWFVRWYHPYITLSKGNAPASESLLLDYIALNKLMVIWFAIRRKHWLIFSSSMVVLASFLLQPLAGAVFSIVQLPDTRDSTVSSIRQIGLAPDLVNLNSFVAAAGFAEAAVVHNLTDPPFIKGGWAAAEFRFPIDAVLNGSMAVNTTGIQTTVNCAAPASLDLQTPAGGANFTIVTSSVDDCTSTVNFNPSTADQQYGVTNVPNCGSTSQNITQQPVMFWYFHRRQDGNPEARSVFCRPKIAVFNIMATASLNNGSLVNVTVVDPYTPSNNVTEAPLSGQAFNGVIFDPPPNPFIVARALATRSGVPGAIFRFASIQENGIQSTFDDPEGFLRLTKQVYTQHLSISAKSVYFVQVTEPLPAKLTQLVPRLRIEPLAAHGLSSILFAMAIAGIIIIFVHQRAGRDLWLSAPPGSIAAIVSLTSRSGFGNLLVPYDDERSMKRKLAGLRFRLDARTGAILADDDGTYDPTLGPDGATMSLLGQKREPDITGDPDYPPSSSLSNTFRSEPLRSPYDP